MKEEIYVYNKLYFQYEEDDNAIKNMNDIDDNDDLIIDSAIANIEKQTNLNSVDTTPIIIDNHLNNESREDLDMREDFMENDNIVIQQAPTCGTGGTPNCGECCAIFTDAARRTAFGYELETATCDCHDICVEDVRDICVHEQTVNICVPCNPDGSSGCRGGFLPDGAPTVANIRVLCAEERLSPATGCDRIINEIGFEVVLRFANGTLVVLTPRATVTCLFNEFAIFPSGRFFPNNADGLAAFRNELTFIDGSCKVILIESATVITIDGNCVLRIVFKVVDKLWKHENLLVSAIKPYGTNVTVDDVFGQGHAITPCTGSGVCTGFGPLA